jgi:hypothetical protein
LKGLTNLKWLYLGGTEVSDMGLANLKGLTGLRLLVLSHTRVSDLGVKSLQKALPNASISH